MICARMKIEEAYFHAILFSKDASQYDEPDLNESCLQFCQKIKIVTNTSNNMSKET